MTLGTVPGDTAPVLDLTYTQSGAGTRTYACIDSAFSEVAVPGPSSIIMLSIGGAFVGGFALRRRSRRAA